MKIPCSPCTPLTTPSPRLPPRRAGPRGIVRLSGPGLRTCLEGCFRPAPFISLPSIARPTAVPGLCWLAGIAAPLPGELYLWPGRRSYTGQPVAEIHTLGSPPLLEALLRTVCAPHRVAEPGEFTLRAFLAGRIDLTQAEAVLGVIDAADGRQLHVALAQLAGGLARPLHRLRDRLLELLAQLEAGLDFAEEELPLVAPGELAGQLDEAAAAIAALLGQMTARQETADLVRVVLAGPPNSGKSSLFNALARDRRFGLRSARHYPRLPHCRVGPGRRAVSTGGYCGHRITWQPKRRFRSRSGRVSPTARTGRRTSRCLDVTRPQDDWHCPECPIRACASG